MKITQTAIAGEFLVELQPHEDSRGSFARSYCRKEFLAAGIDLQIAQANLARTRQAGVVRGIHFVVLPNTESKLVRCIAGAVFDVTVDMRPFSPTYRAVYTVQLDPLRRQSLYIPTGVAHGYQALENETEFLYMTDEFYVAGVEKGLRYNDPALGISWPLAPTDVSERDASWPLLT